jgi:hypothetical protein
VETNNNAPKWLTTISALAWQVRGLISPSSNQLLPFELLALEKCLQKLPVETQDILRKQISRCNKVSRGTSGDGYESVLARVEGMKLLSLGDPLLPESAGAKLLGNTTMSVANEQYPINLQVADGILIAIQFGRDVSGLVALGGDDLA